MRFGDSRENKCKGFNSLGDGRIRVYIQNGGKWNILAKKQRVESIHLIYESIQTTKRQTRRSMKIDKIYTYVESSQVGEDEDWYNLLIMWIESLRQKPKSERIDDTNQDTLNRIMHDTIHQKLNWFKMQGMGQRVQVIRFKLILKLSNLIILYLSLLVIYKLEELKWRVRLYVFL
jgi:hypothetical protein